MERILATGSGCYIHCAAGGSAKGFALSTPILPIFVLVIFLALLIGLLIWRAIYITLVAPRLKSK
jgi:hypothetical protein